MLWKNLSFLSTGKIMTMKLKMLGTKRQAKPPKREKQQQKLQLRSVQTITGVTLQIMDRLETCFVVLLQYWSFYLANKRIWSWSGEAWLESILILTNQNNCTHIHKKVFVNKYRVPVSIPSSQPIKENKGFINCLFCSVFFSVRY